MSCPRLDMSDLLPLPRNSTSIPPSTLPHHSTRTRTRPFPSRALPLSLLSLYTTSRATSSFCPSSSISVSTGSSPSHTPSTLSSPTLSSLTRSDPPATALPRCWGMRLSQDSWRTTLSWAFEASGILPHREGSEGEGTRSGKDRRAAGKLLQLEWSRESGWER